MKILVAVDDKTYAQAVIDCISSLTWEKKPEFKVLSCVPPLRYRIPTTTGVADTRFVEVQEERRRAAKSLVLGVSSQIAQLIPQITVEDVVLDGDPKIKILELATEWNADLIVMGSHGRNNLERLFLGSTSLAVLSHAPCSVLVAKISKTTDKLTVAAGATEKNG
ncbi:MAG TPA: universal stress protein [Drouetiella sp.]|jgi:nucleotide-binding universal stress UspA family protein